MCVRGGGRGGGERERVDFVYLWAVWKEDASMEAVYYTTNNRFTTTCLSLSLLSLPPSFSLSRTFTHTYTPTHTVKSLSLSRSLSVSMYVGVWERRAASCHEVTAAAKRRGRGAYVEDAARGRGHANRATPHGGGGSSVVDGVRCRCCQRGETR
jgi:hypothetical protein